MIRIRSIELSNVKNVANGTIGFKDSPFGSSVMGIYGQNGSGKTAVVESLARVQDLMCGFPLDRESVDLIGPSAECAKISIEVEVTEGSPSSLGFVGGLGGTVAAGKPFTVCYSFSFDRLDDRPRLLSEDLSVRAEGLVKRRLAAYDAADTEDSQNLKPVNRWRALRNLAGREADLDLTVARRSPTCRAPRSCSRTPWSPSRSPRESPISSASEITPYPRRRGRRTRAYWFHSWTPRRS